MKKIIIFALCAVFAVISAGCGGGGSDGTSFVDNTTGTGGTGGTTQLSTQLSSAISKYESDGDPVAYYNQLVSLADPVTTPNISAEERLKVRTAMIFTRSRMDSTSTNYLDLSTSTAVETIKRDVTEASALSGNVTVPQDSRVLLASAYLAQTSGNQSSNIRSAITQIETLGTSGGVFNPNFTYKGELGFKVSNADVHALLAQCYFWNGQDTDAQTQLQIATTLDPTLSSSTVRNIKEALELYGISSGK